MHRRREPARPVTPTEAGRHFAIVVNGQRGLHAGASPGRDSGQPRRGNRTVPRDSESAPVVAAPGPPFPVHGRRFFHHPGVWASAVAVGGPGDVPATLADRSDAVRPSAPLDTLQIDRMLRLSRSLTRRVASK